MAARPARPRRWSVADGLAVHGVLPPLPALPTGPNFVFIGASGDRYLLGVVPAYDGAIGTGHLLTVGLFPGRVPGALDLSAFHPAGEFGFPVASRASQVHLVTDATGQHFLLAYRASQDDDESGDDFVDVHPVSFEPFAVSPAIASVHIFLRPGKTSFGDGRARGPRLRRRESCRVGSYAGLAVAGGCYVTTATRRTPSRKIQI